MTDQAERKYVLITGAASDVGRVLALDLSAEYDLLLTDYDVEELENTAKVIREHSSANVILWEQNLLDGETIEASLAEVLADHGITVSKFIHLAGFCRKAPLKMMRHSDYNDAFNLMVTSAAMIIKSLTSRKINARALDSAILVSSSSAVRGVKTFSAYGAAKAAMNGLMRNLAIELAPRVRVNSILPGGMITRATEALYEDEAFRSRAEKLYPLGIGTPDKLKGLVRLLLSDDADWITGQEIVIDGGRTTDGTE